MDWSIESSLVPCGAEPVCGVDEAGRGPLAGSVFAAAVILPSGLVIEGLNDSKKLSVTKREKLFDKITSSALAYAITSASVEEIDKLNILEATLLAMRRAIEALEIKPNFVLVDGNINKGFSVPAKAVVGGDGVCPSIAAASILAKVARDRYCLEMDKLYPEYGFAKNKGYGTKAHREALQKHGACPLHRSLFIRRIIPNGDCDDKS